MNSSELKGFLTGLILGDGHIDGGTTKRAFNISSIDKNFIDMIESEIKSCSGFKTKRVYIPAHYSCGCNHKDAWKFIIVAHPYFAKMYHYFYDDYRHRVISKEALNWLTPRGLANWYMSDGYVCKVGKTKGVIRNRRMDICTDRYSYNDVLRASNWLKDRFEIDNGLIKRNDRYRIRIKVSSYEKFINLIQPYVIPSMQYKLYLAYEYKPIWMSDEMWKFQESLESAALLSSDTKDEDIV